MKTIINKEILERAIEDSTESLYTEHYEGGCGGGYSYEHYDLSEATEEIIENYIRLMREENIDTVEKSE